MRRARPLNDVSGELAGYVVECPACGCWHCFNVPNEKADAAAKAAGKKRPTWHFNGDLERPTFTPSMLVFEMEGGQRRTICHSFVTGGEIQFLKDCAHEMRGQTVDLPDVDA